MSTKETTVGEIWWLPVENVMTFWEVGKQTENWCLVSQKRGRETPSEPTWVNAGKGFTTKKHEICRTKAPGSLESRSKAARWQQEDCLKPLSEQFDMSPSPPSFTVGSLIPWFPQETRGLMSGNTESLEPLAEKDHGWGSVSPSEGLGWLTAPTPSCLPVFYRDTSS